MRVLIADKFPASGREVLGRSGEVVYRPELGEADLPGALRETGADILVVRSTVVNAAAMEAPNLSLVIRAGAGVNTIDLKAASSRGIFVANCPGKNAIAVAELTFALLLALDRRVVDATVELRQGVWNKAKYGKARGIKGQTLGLVGFGMIGREVAQRARAFGMKVQCHVRNPPSPEECEALGVTVAPSLEALLRTSDVVSVHVPYNKQTTHHLIGSQQLALLKPGSIVLHTSRGGVIDDAALAEAVRSGHVRAGLDVFEAEPAEGKASYKGLPAELSDVYATPHIGASTEQAESAISDEVLRIVHDYVTLGVVHHSVNLADRNAQYSLVVRHLDRVGVLAGVLSALREESVNVQGMHNIIFAGGEAGCATITCEQPPSEALLQRIRSSEAILAVELRGASAAA